MAVRLRISRTIPVRNVMRTLMPWLLLMLAPAVHGGGWLQWGNNAEHQNSSPAVGQPLERILANIVYDPFVATEMETGGDDLLVHYQAPLVDGQDVFMTFKSGTYISSDFWNLQVWNVKKLSWSAARLEPVWSYASDWKPVPAGGVGFEPVFHPALDRETLYIPGAGGTVLEVKRSDGELSRRINPFGTSIDQSIYLTGPLTIDSAGNVFYNAVRFNPAAPWDADILGAWLVRINAAGETATVRYDTLVPDPPGANSLCRDVFANADLPWPPSPNAIPPSTLCGSQRPGINVAPAVGPDGTIYTVSRAHFNSRWSYLVAVTPELNPKWATSLRDRFNDGCNVRIPLNGTPGGCRVGARTGVDPSDNTLGAGRVVDDSTASPTVAPDGSILYGAYTRYNYSSGHLMKFSPEGVFIGAYPFGWDFTPTIYEHDDSWSVILKENHYRTGSYCGNPSNCPANRTAVTPRDPEQYFITRLDPDLRVQWQFRSTNSQSCGRLPDGSLSCVSDHPAGFEWCVNAAAVDSRGVVFANSEDGSLYAIGPDGDLVDSQFLQLALGAAYTPLAIGPNGLIYAQNAGHLFVVGSEAPGRRRPLRRP